MSPPQLRDENVSEERLDTSRRFHLRPSSRPDPADVEAPASSSRPSVARHAAGRLFAARRPDVVPVIPMLLPPRPRSQPSSIQPLRDFDDPRRRSWMRGVSRSVALRVSFSNHQLPERSPHRCPAHVRPCVDGTPSHLLERRSSSFSTISLTRSYYPSATRSGMPPPWRGFGPATRSPARAASTGAPSPRRPGTARLPPHPSCPAASTPTPRSPKVQRIRHPIAAPRL